MAAVRYRLRAELRTRSRSLVAVGLLVGAAIAVANLTPLAPARIAARLRPATVLRSE